MSEQIQGLDELLANMDRLSFQLRAKYLRRAVLKAAREAILPRMKQGAPRDKGELADDLMVSTKDSNAAEGIAEIGPSKKTAWRARFIEKGVRPHLVTIKSSRVLMDLETGEVFGVGAQHPGLAANPFMQRSLEDGHDHAIQIMGEVLSDALEEELA